MKKKYAYSILQYHHSQAAGEVMNIGLLFYLPTSGKLTLITPKDFERYKAAYPGFSTELIETYFNYFDARLKLLSDDPGSVLRYTIGYLGKLIKDQLLTPDSSMLQFSRSQSAILYTDMEKVIGNLSVMYLYTEPEQLEVRSFNGLNAKKAGDWIYPDFKNKIPKIDKNHIFLPRQNELTFKDIP
ncbi:MAG: DUF3037 domain-containing protein [Daejeonella sp.]